MRVTLVCVSCRGGSQSLGAESLQPSQARRSAPRSRGNLGAVGITSFRAKQQRRKDARVLKILPRGAGRRRGAAGRGADYAHEVDFDWGAEALQPLSMAGWLAERTPREREGPRGSPSTAPASGALARPPRARPARGSPAGRARLSAYVTSGHAGAPTRGKQGGGGGQGAGGWGSG